MSVIGLKKANCKNCYKCLKVCPVKSIRVVNEQAQIIDDDCLLCGTCLANCPQNAKTLTSSLDQVKEMLASGEKVAVSLAPSFLGSFSLKKPGQMAAALKKLGFCAVSETAQGAAYVTAQYHDLMVENKMKNIITGGVTETSFNPTAKFENAYVEKKDMEYSYNDGDLYYFMDQETYDMIPIAAELLGDNFRFVKENMPCKVNSYKGKVFAVEPPTFVELEVTETDPGFKGDTATNVTKPATLETGVVIQVPIFVNIGDRVKVDTRTNGYLGRE